MAQAHKLTVSRTAHYYTIGKPSKKIKRFWIACHGYGQLAKTFVRRFEGLDDGETFVLAPEGLNKFYWGQFTGDPVATWMTSEHRLDEIADYCNYLQKLYDHYLPLLADDVEIILLGFSQGTATQCRWAMQNFPRFDHLILWAGLLPDDLDFRPQQSYFSDKKLHFVYGTEDPFLKEKRLQWQLDFAKKNLLDLNVFTFPEKHLVDRDALLLFNKKHIEG
ncbi:MAG TPA: phospholipase [Bacteroidetes bacterium]|nr:phospholipase [Bacteroidota bacterium]